MAQLRKPIERDGYRGLLGRVATPVAASVAAPPAPAPVAAPAVAAPANIPSMTDYIAKRLAEAPEYIEDELGNTVFDYSRGDAKFAQEWADTYRPDLRQQGFLINSPWGVEENFSGVTKDRSDIGERWTQSATLNPDGTIGEVRDPKYQKKSAGIKGFIKPVLAVASVIPSPFQPFAQVANAALAASEGKPLNAALSLYGAANSTGLLDGISAPPGGVDNYDLQGNFDLNPGYVPGGVDNYDLQGNFDLNPSYVPPSAPIDLTSQLQSQPVPGYDFTSPNFDLPDPGLVNNPLTNTPVPGFTTPEGLTLPSAAGGLLGATPSQSPIDPLMSRAADSQLANEQLGIQPGEVSNMPSSPAVVADPSGYDRFISTGRQLVAAGKDTELYKWVTDPANAAYVKTGMAAGGALLNTVGGSSSGGSSYKDDGYRPTISRGGFQASIPGGSGTTPGGAGMAPGGAMSGVTLPTTGQANDGLWRYAGNRSQGGLLPSLSAAMPQGIPRYQAPTGLISPPSVASYDPRPTGPVPTNVPPMQYGYDDPVPLNRTQLSPEMQRAMSPFLGLLNTSPTRGFF